MTSQDAIQTAVKAIDNMTGDELAQWVAAGDYTSVGGVDLPETATKRLTEAMADPEVAGYAFDLGLGSIAPRSGNLGSGLGGSQPGDHIERKAGGGQQEFLKLTLTQILIG
ncbi:MAG: hypothetical protein QOC92_4681 [Acidimicrobiaceae bacterium]